jgi:hypothetical protein
VERVTITLQMAHRQAVQVDMRIKELLRVQSQTQYPLLWVLVVKTTVLKEMEVMAGMVW